MSTVLVPLAQLAPEKASRSSWMRRWGTRTSTACCPPIADARPLLLADAIAISLASGRPPHPAGIRRRTNAATQGLSIRTGDSRCPRCGCRIQPWCRSGESADNGWPASGHGDQKLWCIRPRRRHCIAVSRSGDPARADGHRSPLSSSALLRARRDRRSGQGHQPEWRKR